jgi:hypothetical protein
MEVKLVKRDDHYGLYNEDGHKIAATLDGCNSKLSKQNCNEIFGVVDVEKLAENKYGKGIYEIEQVDAYIEGFNKAMELYQPTEIEVEIDMQCLDPTCDGINRKGICIPGDKPKLDSQGCLMLKKI